uniref:Uncharacterized protein n=1 Tax=Arundo donax TaxID=35708 RepID=A0A0A8XZT8_ARUDO
MHTTETQLLHMSTHALNGTPDELTFSQSRLPLHTSPARSRATPAPVTPPRIQRARAAQGTRGFLLPPSCRSIGRHASSLPRHSGLQRCRRCHSSGKGGWAPG